MKLLIQNKKVDLIHLKIFVIDDSMTRPRQYLRKLICVPMCNFFETLQNKQIMCFSAILPQEIKAVQAALS